MPPLAVKFNGLPSQMLPPLMLAVGRELIVVDKVAVVAHCPASGVNVYIPPIVLSIVAGSHVPVIAGVLVELAGNKGASVPLQNAGIVAKVGGVGVVTVVVNVAVVAHCPASGVNVYVLPIVLSIVAGSHVPVIAGILVELAGNKGASVPLQKAGIAAKVGVVCALIVTSKLPLQPAAV